MENSLQDRFETELRERPLAVIAGALVAGAIVGLKASARTASGDRRHGRVATLAISLAGTLAMKLVRDLVMSQVGKLAQERWSNADAQS